MLNNLLKILGFVLTIGASAFLSRRAGAAKQSQQQTQEAIHDIEEIRKVELENDATPTSDKRNFLQNR